ncbi:unnamed protein product [Meganyctiphanes norvegica]|uniref:Uncharacterized protein n=1 Tax=Meganyctiphanes norvegica TaxID=48144 RepID=A0AAV2RGI5_MEGNR
MYDILNICVLFGLTFVLVYGDECKNKKEGLDYIKCSVYKLELQQECPMATSDGDKRFVFYINQLTKGNLSISLYDRDENRGSIERSNNLFNVTMDNANTWYMIKIKRGNAKYHLGTPTYKYSLYVNGLIRKITDSDYEAGNEIRMKTLRSLWTSECDPRDYTSEYIECSVNQINQIESQQECPLATNDGDGNFVFYIKQFTKGQLSISLYKRYENGSSIKRFNTLFDVTMDKAKTWYFIRIQRGDARTTSGLPRYKYSLDVKGQIRERSDSDYEAGNEIRVKSANSLWTYECDPRNYTVPPQPSTPNLTIPQSNTSTEQTSQPTTSTQPTPQPTTSSQPTPSGTVQSQPHLTTTNTGIGAKKASNIPVITAVSSVLILVVILVIVILVIRHRRRNRDAALTKPTDHQNRVSRHVSENSLYESYDIQGTGENQVPQDNSATNSANQRRGSAHDSENSLYGNFN